MSERQNVEIDYCPQCRGVWLDRGELDKIIERLESQGASQPQSPPPQQPRYDQPQPPTHRDRDYDDDDYKRNGHYRKKHRRESWFGELFD